MTIFDTLVIGDESLTQHCAEHLVSQGHRITALVTDNTDIARWAQDRGIRVEHHGRDLAARLQGVATDWVLSIANLRLLPRDVIAMGRKGAVNFHDGPLPKRAGLNAPVWAVMEGDTSHGITWHLIEEGVDTGDIIVQRRFDVTSEDTALTVNTKCYEAGLDSFPDLLTELANGLPSCRMQNPAERSYHALADRPEDNGVLRFDQSAEDALRLIRALDHGSYWNPLCTPKLRLGDTVLSVGGAEIIHTTDAPGTVIEATETTLTCAFAQGALRFADLKSLTGEPIMPSDIARSGDVLAQTTHLDQTAVFAELAKKDAVWRAALAGTTPVTLPFLSEQPGEMEQSQTNIDPAFLHEALSSLSHHMSPESNPILAFANEAIARQARQSDLISPWVPLSADHTDDFNPTTSFAKDLALRDPNIGALQTPALALSHEAGAVPQAAITFEITGSNVSAHIDTGRIPSEFAQILIRRVEWLAQQLADGTPANALNMLPSEERAEVLDAHNVTAKTRDAHATMHAAFEAQVARTPDAVALVYEATELTFADLNVQANRIAHVLRQEGVTPDTMVGLFCHRGSGLIAGALGILKAGGAYVPLDPDYPKDRLEHYLKDSAAPFVVTELGLQADLPDHNAQVLVLDDDDRLARAQTDNPAPTAQGEHLAYMIYTSGSTGLPKGVMVEHRNVLNFYAGMDDVVPDRDDATWLAVTSLSFDISVLELFYTMSRGIKVVLPGRDIRGAVSSGVPRQRGDSMDFSVYYWGNDDGVGRDKYRLLLEGAKFADDNGFCAIWTPERHFHAFGGPYPNPSVTGAAVAGATKQIGVRAGSCVAPLHHPARIAEEWAVIDNLTNGRAGVAIASGWQPDDFVLRPENTPPENKPAMFDAIDKVRKLWRGEAVGFPRKDGEMHEVVTQPRPVSKELPIWVTTAGNPETWREAGRNGANVLTHLLGQSIEEVAEKIDIYRTALRDAGHKPDDFTVTLMLHTFIADTRDEAREIAREPMKDYLRSAAGLIKQYAWAFPAFKKPEGVNNAFELNLGDLNEEELEGILDFAFERYFNDSGLFGTVEDALERVEQVKAIGVGEIACLIDYGIHADRVLEGLRPLAEVVRHCAPEVEADDDYSIAAMLKRHNATHMQCTPSMARMIMMDDDARARLAGLKHLFLGGEALPGALVSELQQSTDASITNMYGPTETTIWSSTEPATSDEATVNIGTPIANTQLYVLDDAQNPMGYGEEGELWIGGDGVTRGYWNREDVTADRFRDNPFAPGRMYRTGDLVARRMDGRLNFFGRTDHQVKLRGFRIELGEIESVLLDMDGVTNAVVLAREDEPGDVRLVAYLTTTREVTAQEMRAHSGAHLPDYMVPAHLVVLDAFPVTPNKKIDRKALPAPTIQAPKAVPAEAPATPVAGSVSDEALRTQVAAIWSEILGVANISASDNFFELGGHSLLAIQAHRTLRDRLALQKLSITDIFRFPTLGDLSAHIAKLSPAVARAEPAPAANVAQLTQPAAQDRAQTRADAMAKRRAMRARRRA